MRSYVVGLAVGLTVTAAVVTVPIAQESLRKQPESLTRRLARPTGVPTFKACTIWPR